MTEQRPIQEFGRRRPVAATPPEPRKRSGHVALLVMGTLAVGGASYAVMPRNNCEPPLPGMAAPLVPPDNTACTSRSSSSGSGGHGSRYGFYSGDSSGRSSSATSSDSATSHVTRGGFGGFAHAFGFSGHG